MVDSEWHQDIDLEERGEEGLWVDEEEWVDVTADGEELESWGRGGRGVGILGMVCVTVCTVSRCRCIFSHRETRLTHL